MPDPLPIAIAPARSPAEIDAVRTLFREYVAGLGIDLSFQDVEAEFAGLPGKYAPPGGALLLAVAPSGRPVGCVGLRALPEPGVCEMKRLYLRDEARGHALGRRLAEAVIAAARAAGYRQMKLDSLPSMVTAQGLYASLGFRPTEAYCENPIPGTSYLELDLAPS